MDPSPKDTAVTSGRPDPPAPVSGGARNADLAAAAAPAPREPGEDLGERQEELLEEAVEETFPASDPISPAVIVGPDEAAWKEGEATPGRGG